MTDAPFPLFGELLALASAFGWAVAVVLFKRVGETRNGAEGLGPVALNTFKNTLAFVLLPPTILLAGQSLWPDPTWQDVVLMLFSGFLGMGVSDTLYLMALNRLGAAAWSIVLTLYAPMVVGLAWLFLGEHLGTGQLIGVGLVVIALVLVSREPKAAVAVAKGVADGASADTPDTPDTPTMTRRDWLLGLGYAFAGMLTMAVSIVMLKPALDRAPLLWATEMRLGGGLIFLAGAIVMTKRPGRLFAPLRNPGVLKLTVPASFIAAYLTLLLLLGGLKYAGASVGSVLNQLSNLFIFLLAVLFLKEPANLRRWAGVALGVTGATLVMLGRP